MRPLQSILRRSIGEQMNITLNASEYVTTSYGQALPEITATIRDLGAGEAFFFSLLVLLASVVLHELGHWIALLKHNKGAKIYVKRVNYGLQLQTGTEADYMILEKNEKINLYLSGIVAGLIPIGIASLIHPIYALVLPGYIVGCVNDFKLIWYQLKTKKTNEESIS